MKIKEICSLIEAFAPLSLQENYDNAGLQVGNPEQEVKAILLSIDVTEDVIDEAINKSCNMIIAHHPLIFKGVKSITGKNYVERCILKAIKNDISVYASHTNMDAVEGGVNSLMAQKIGLQKVQMLSPLQHKLLKLVVFVPIDRLEQVRTAVFEAGAGAIGNYDYCSFNQQGEGTFRGNEHANPFVGDKGELHTEPEVRFEVILPDYLRNKVERAILKSHPYEEPAYDFYQTQNTYKKAGFGVVGELKEEMSETDFLDLLKKTFNISHIRHTPLLSKTIKKAAMCGGSGSFLLATAKSLGADVFVSGDFKYHDFFDAEKSILIADIGHFESEQFTKEIFFEIIRKNLPNFAVYFSEVNTNPINYR